MCIECHSTPCNHRCPNAEVSESVECCVCGTEVHIRSAKRLYPHGEPHCPECFADIIERLCGADEEEEE